MKPAAECKPERESRAPESRGPESRGPESACPVCEEPYRNVRLLDCGHRFCYPCLLTISSGNHGNRKITCPSCCHVTDKDPRDLAKLPGDAFREEVTSFLRKDACVGRCDRKCGVCDLGKTAASCCVRCKVALCPSCLKGHQKAEEQLGHKVTLMSKRHFCSTHSAMFVSLFCLECKALICLICYTKHANHSCKDVEALAQIKRDVLKNDVTKSIDLEGDMTLAETVEKVKVQLGEMGRTVPELVGKIRGTLDVLDKKVETLGRQCQEVITAEVKSLDLMSSDLQDYINTKVSLITHLHDLTLTASDAEVISRTNDYPMYASAAYLDHSEKTTYKLPSLGGLTSVLEDLQKARQSCDVIFSDVAFMTSLHDDAIESKNEQIKQWAEFLKKLDGRIQIKVSEKVSDVMKKKTENKETPAIEGKGKTSPTPKSPGTKLSKKRKSDTKKSDEQPAKAKKSCKDVTKATGETTPGTMVAKVGNTSRQPGKAGKRKKARYHNNQYTPAQPVQGGFSNTTTARYYGNSYYGNMTRGWTNPWYTQGLNTNTNMWQGQANNNNNNNNNNNRYNCYW